MFPAAFISGSRDFTLHFHFRCYARAIIDTQFDLLANGVSGLHARAHASSLLDVQIFLEKMDSRKMSYCQKYQHAINKRSGSLLLYIVHLSFNADCASYVLCITLFYVLF